MPATYYNIELLSPPTGVAGTGGAPIVAGGVEVFEGFDPEADGVATVSATSASEALQRAVVGTVTVDLFANGSELADHNFREETSSLSTTDGKPFLIEALGNGVWRIRLENAPEFPGPTSGPYDDGYWDVSVAVDAAVSGNVAPVTVAERIVTGFDAAVVVSPLVNDTDGDGDYLTLTEVGANGVTAHGFATIDADGRTFQYVPNAGFVGTDTVSYVVSDGEGGTTTGTVSVVVYDKPVATVTVPDDDVTPEVDDPNAAVSFTLHLSGQTTSETAVSYRVTVLDGPDFTNVVSQTEQTVTFAPGQSSQQRTFLLAGITTEVRLRIEVIEALGGVQPPGGGVQPPGAPPPPLAAYAIDPIESVRPVFVRQRGAFLMVVDDLANEATPAKTFTVTYSINNVFAASVTYHGLTEFSETAGNVTKTVRVASCVSFTLTNQAEVIGKRYGERMEVTPPGYVTNQDDRSHLMARMYGGRDDLRNCVPLISNVNQGRMKQLEKQILAKAKALPAGATLTVVVTPKYNERAIRAELRRAARVGAAAPVNLTVARPKAVRISSASDVLPANDPVSGNRKTTSIQNK